MTGGAVFVIRWILYLAFTQPQNFTVRGWPLTWVASDSLLVVVATVADPLKALMRRIAEPPPTSVVRTISRDTAGRR